MGWFWAEAAPPTRPTVSSGNPQTTLSQNAAPPPGCPMHKTSPSSIAEPSSSQSPSACPYVPPSGASTPSSTQRSNPPSTIAAMAGQSIPQKSAQSRSWNPLNNMFSDLSQSRESSSQTMHLPLERETSSIPRGGSANNAGTQGDNWVYPSPQQMYNALIRKGYADTPQDAMESMVAVHNFLNEGAWAEIVEWERRFAKGLMHGWRVSRFGEDGCLTGAMIASSDDDDLEDQPRLMRFQGRSDDMTPKASMLQWLGWAYPSRFAGPPPFDRHDWYIERVGADGKPREVRYVIDYYSGPPEPTGEPVFYLDIRPALDRPGAVMERFIRTSRDLWWRGSGGRARLEENYNHR